MWHSEMDLRVIEKSVSKVHYFISGLFGICNYGVDINGYVMDSEKGLCIWLQRRSATKQTWPGKWDNMVSMNETVP
jgi:thiamine pyrophosphokinase